MRSIAPNSCFVYKHGFRATGGISTHLEHLDTQGLHEYLQYTELYHVTSDTGEQCGYWPGREYVNSYVTTRAPLEGCTMLYFFSMLRPFDTLGETLSPKPHA